MAHFLRLDTWLFWTTVHRHHRHITHSQPWAEGGDSKGRNNNESGGGGSWEDLNLMGKL